MRRDGSGHSDGYGTNFSRRGFSIVELIAVVGVLMILLGFTLPALKNSREQANRTRQISNIRQDAIAVVAYCSQNDDVFPISDANAWVARHNWSSAARRLGLLDERPSSWPMPSLSVAMTYSPTRMVPGLTEHPNNALSFPIQSSRVRWPSGKGMLNWLFLPDGPFGSSTAWCCYTYTEDDVYPRDAPLPESPVAFADGSAEIGTWRDYFLPGSPSFENQVGIPIISTWSGCYGIDRR